MRSPKQVEIRAKARGLKVPTGIDRFARSGVSLVRVENARAPMPGRGEIVRSFSAALEALPGREAMTEPEPNHDPVTVIPITANDNGEATALPSS